LASSFTFHRNSKPGFWRLSLEILPSFRIHDERYASLPLVIQSPAPRPNWACAAPIHTNKPRSPVATTLANPEPLLRFIIAFPTPSRWPARRAEPSLDSRPHSAENRHWSVPS